MKCISSIYHALKSRGKGPLTGLLLALLLIHHPAFSEELKFRNIGMNEGLSFNSVLCIIQDHEGFVWIGTRDGINKYDGVDNTIYKHVFYDSLSLSNNHINSIFEDSQKNIWIGTANGLNLLKNSDHAFTRFFADGSSKGLSNRYVKCITESKNHSIWIGTSIGVNIYDPVNETITPFRIKEIESNTNNIIALYRDTSDRIWLCTRGGLFISDDSHQFQRIILDASLEGELDLFEFRDLIQDETGAYWAATENHGLFSFRFDGGQVSQLKNYTAQNSSITSNHIRRLRIIQGKLWCATLGGISTVEINTGYTAAITGDGLSTSSFHDILEDTEGGIWLASYTDGINYYHRQNNLFPHIKKGNSGLNDNSVTGFLDDGEKGIWISTGGGGLNYYDRRKDTFTYITSENSGLSNNNIKAMCFDLDSNLWIGTYEGLNFYDRKKKSITTFLHERNNLNSLIQNQIHATHVDEDGLVWIGSNGGGIQVLNPRDMTIQTVTTVFTNINTFYEDRKNRIWIGSNSGLECVDRITKKQIDLTAAGIQDDKLVFINCISEDLQGRILIGTQNHGLCMIDGDTNYWFNKSNGFITNTVYAFLEGKPNTYWIATNDGLAKVELSETLGPESEFSCTEFDISHGLQNKQFYPGCAMKDRDGKLYFGGVTGYNYFIPEAIEKRVYYPPVAISELRITDENPETQYFIYPTRSYSKDTAILLEYSQRNIQLKFAGIFFANPSKLYYRYKLDDKTKYWNSLQNQRSINITYLPVGNHELKLQASSSPDSWGEDFTVVKFKVLPPIWRTWWAYLIYVSVLVLLLYLYFHFTQEWTHLKSSLNMEQFQKEKEKELHESKLRFFTDVSHELRTPLTLILAPIENIVNQPNISGRFKNQLLMIQRNGNRMTQLINQLLDLRKLETGNDRLKVAPGDFLKFIREICLAFDAVSEINQINFQIVTEEKEARIWFDRDKMEIVFYNLLSNAFKYTPKGGKIQLEINAVEVNRLPQELRKLGSEGGFEIIITDSGQGISKEDLENIFERFYSKRGMLNSNPTGIGLELAKRMIEMHHGHIFVKSQEETMELHGFTSFIIYLINGKSHFSPEELIEDFKNSEDVSQYTKDFILREKQIELPILEEDSDPVIHNRNKKTLLVVEDNVEVRKFIVDLLNSEYNVVEAENGKKGLEEAIRIGPDLVICDIMMPEMNGIELCRQIKMDTRISHTPVILLTARTAITFKFEGYETGADEYITKPFSAIYLKLRIKNILHQRDVLQKHFRTEAILEPTELSITSVDEKLIKKAIDYINNNISNTNITVNELSRELGLSRVHFYRKMKALTNMTAIEFIRSIRLRRACRLLEQGKFNIKEVKNLVGFENADYFRNCFKEAYNLTPSEYAEKFKNQHTNNLAELE